jgi:DNA polymerase III alpha subunit
MAMITVQDRAGSIDGVVFSDVFAKCAEHLQDAALVLVIGVLDRKQGEPQIIVDDVIPLEQAARHLAGGIEIELAPEPDGSSLDEQMQMVAGLLENAHASRGGTTGRPANVTLHLHTGGKRISMRSQRLKPVADAHLLGQLRGMVGERNVRVVSAGVPKREKKKRW